MTRRPSHRRRDPARHFAILGIAAILVTAAIGYVSFTALGGLPLQDKRHLNVEVPNANRLIDANEVRIGGVRVGQVSRVEARPARAGRPPYARVELTLDGSVDPLPVDTTVRVRPASILGATYVELAPGDSRDTIAEHGTLPLSRASTTIELIDLFDVFDRRAARSFRSATRGLAGGLAGRGPALNTAIGSLSRAMPPLTHVAGALAAPDARLGRFLRTYASTAEALGPVDADLGRLVSGASTTFGALAGERAALARAIEGAPPAEAAATDALRRVQPGLDGLARLTSELRPAARLVPGALGAGNDALAAGVTPLRRLPALGRTLRRTLATLHVVSRRPTTTGALRKLSDLMRAADRTLEVLAPAQVHCNIVALLGQNFSAYTGTLGVGHGPSFWNFPFSTTGAQTDGSQAKEPAPDLGVNYTPNENAQECESGNEPAPGGGRRTIGNPPGLQSSRVRDTDPPPGVRERARAAGLLDEGGGRP